MPSMTGSEFRILQGIDGALVWTLTKLERGLLERAVAMGYARCIKVGVCGLLGMSSVRVVGRS